MLWCWNLKVGWCWNLKLGIWLMHNTRICCCFFYPLLLSLFFLFGCCLLVEFIYNPWIKITIEPSAADSFGTDRKIFGLNTYSIFLELWPTIQSLDFYPNCVPIPLQFLSPQQMVQNWTGLDEWETGLNLSTHRGRSSPVSLSFNPVQF